MNIPLNKNLLEKAINDLWNPYPPDIFIPPGEKDWKKLHVVCKENGFMLDAFSAEMGRRVFELCKEDILRLLNSEELEDRENEILNLITAGMTTDGEHHKQWCLVEAARLMGVEIDEGQIDMGQAP